MPTLDPEARALLDAVPIPPFHTVGLDEARALSDAGGLGESLPLPVVQDLAVPGAAGDLPARLYRATEDDRGAPLLVFFHGGGFVLCGLESHDSVVRALALGTGCPILAVDYRLAPEHPFPAAPDDAYAATVWATEHAVDFGGDPERVAVIGDSAGGNLSAVTALRARDEGGPALVAQVLLYPVTAHVTDDEAMRENAEAPLLTAGDVAWFQELYLPDSADVAHPYASPLRAESLEGLPPAVVVTAGNDPLRDQGDAYARRLHEAGVPVEHLRFDTLFHGFLSFAGLLAPAQRALDAVTTTTRKVLSL